MKPEEINGKMYQPVESVWCGELSHGGEFIKPCAFLSFNCDKSELCSKLVREDEKEVYFIEIK